MPRSFPGGVSCLFGAQNGSGGAKRKCLSKTPKGFSGARSAALPWASGFRVRRAKAALSSGCKPHRQSLQPEVVGAEPVGRNSAAYSANRVWGGVIRVAIVPYELAQAA